MAQDDIPEGRGYPLFGVAHILSVAITLACVAAIAVGFVRMDDRKQRRFLKLLPVVMAGLEVLKDIVLALNHRFGLGYLPLHMCSVGMFVFFFREYLPGKRAKDVLGEIALVLVLPASLAALIFADWTVYYPVLNFINIHSYIWHGALVLYPVLIMLRGEISPSIKHIHWNIIFLCIVVPPIYLFDKRFGCNYFFLNWPVPDSPLSWCASFMGNPGYLIGYAAMTLAAMLLVYICLGVAQKKV